MLWAKYLPEFLKCLSNQGNIDPNKFTIEHKQIEGKEISEFYVKGTMSTSTRLNMKSS
jgi:hypothetical protein